MIADPHTRIDNFERIYAKMARVLVKEGQRVGDKPHQMQDAGDEWTPVELTNVVIEYSIPDTSEALAIDVRPSTPWAEDHFLERVSGKPLNPPPSAAYWPFKRNEHEEYLLEGKFSHTYPERMWPKGAGALFSNGAIGIRFPWGDLNDLVELLARNPYTRQAYLPIWFPEDLTAARQGERVPCTLGYHFLLREDKLNLFYPIRSCDLVRFFRDDVYMACRLVQWVVSHFKNQPEDPPPSLWDVVRPGTLTMHIISLHCFEGDLPLLRKNYG